MDRDAPLPVSAPSEEVVPPFEWAAVRRAGSIGLAMLAGAAALGGVATAVDVGWGIHTARLLLVLVGSITVGAAVSMRPDLWPAWALGAVGAALAVVGTPAHWDSFRFLFLVLASVAVVFTVARAAPRWRLPVLSAVLLFHFAGIFFATTTPPATPWVTEQAFVRVYNPYLQFLYLRNAYHFYSPQPGPASLLVFMLRTENTDAATGEKTYETKWVVMPRRPADVKDPLGLTYYRRLSLTEQLARGSPGLRAGSFERDEILARRKSLSVTNVIPMHPVDDQDTQYQLPNSEVQRFVIPSYASHVILEHTPDAKTAARTTVRIYRMQHNTLGVEEFNNWQNHPGGTSPYHPMTYRPYYVGEYNARGDLLNSQEPMLYWLVPILPRPGGTPPGQTKRPFLDYLSFHALGPEVIGPDTRVVDLDDPKFKKLVFDWDQLR